MKYSNIVHFKPKEGMFNDVVKLLSEPLNATGILQNIIVKTSDTTCCAIGIWESETHLINARPIMIERLNSVRDKLSVLSEELGVTDPSSGPVIYEDTA